MKKLLGNSTVVSERLALTSLEDCEADNETEATLGDRDADPKICLVEMNGWNEEIGAGGGKGICGITDGRVFW